jgi:hypothetical protein
LSTVFGSGAASAANVDVQWQNPDHYRDVQATGTSQAKFRQQVFKVLDKQFREEAGRLPGNQTLHVTVNNLDLAGEIEYFWNDFPEGIRVMRRVDFPRMELSYELRGADNKVLKSGNANLHDLGFQDDLSARLDSSPLRYEKSMVRNWARETFKEQ